MSELYEKLAKLREENNRNSSKSRHIKNIENNVFTQLLSIAFSNESEPDNLPQVFTIHNVEFYPSDFESLMKRIGLDVNVKKINFSYVRGFTFEVTQKPSTKA